jgi:hypothetical protein
LDQQENNFFIFSDLKTMIKKSVTFSDNIIIIEEPLEIKKELHLSRINNFMHFQLDKLRYEALLTPIFNVNHRKKILLRNKMNNM